MFHHIEKELALRELVHGRNVIYDYTLAECMWEQRHDHTH